MKTNDIVRFKKGLYPDEINSKYKVIEVNGDRVIIEHICNLPIPPQSVAKVDELEICAS